jgi:Domain of unknown function (DUF4267)
MPDPTVDAPAGKRGQRLLLWLGGGAGVVLFVIGIRFLVVPEAATRTFGLGGQPTREALDAVIGLRDLWLGGLAIAFAVLREWRALALWLLMGAGVCFGDVLIVACHKGPWPALAFHVASGVFCAGVGVLSLRIARRGQRPRS